MPATAASDVVESEIKCPQCSKTYQVYMKFAPNPQTDEDFKKLGKIAFPKENKLKCDCGFEIDLTGLRNQVETMTGKKVVH